MNRKKIVAALVGAAVGLCTIGVIYALVKGMVFILDTWGSGVAVGIMVALGVCFAATVAVLDVKDDDGDTP